MKPAGSSIVQALDDVWQAAVRRHPDLPADVVLTVGSVRRGRKLGHFAPGCWAADDGTRHEVLVVAEALNRGPLDVLDTVLHEAAHGLNQARGQSGASRNGRYHNRVYAAAAQELGLDVAEMPPYGLAQTAVPATTAKAYARELRRLTDALTVYRMRSKSTGGTPTNSNVVATCGCTPARKVRVARGTLALGPITCGLCAQAFR
jgi:hypothetical protein